MSLITSKDISIVRVSSVLNRDVKNFGKNNIFDGSSDTCWNSDEGKPQWVSVELSEPRIISSFNIEFQGGFVGQNCLLETVVDEDTFSEPFYPEDKNGIQKFSVSAPRPAKNFKFVFNESTDFFGRVVVYSIQLFSH